MRVSAAEGHRIWSATYDEGLNPVLALDSRVLSERLGALDGLRIVDVACGTGRWMVEAAGRGADVIGIDLSGDMLAVAASKPGLTGKLMVGESSRLPIRCGCADLALCSMALSYFPSLLGAFSEMRRIVRPGGRLIVSDLHPDALAAGWTRSFRVNGAAYEMEHQTFGIRELDQTAALVGLSPLWEIDPTFGLAERWIFERAGKAMPLEHPALHIACWTKP